MNNLSDTAKKVLLSNWFDFESECYAEHSTPERQTEMLNQFVTEPESMKVWIADLRHDAELDKDEFPEHAKEYIDTANELEKIVLKAELDS